jgi:nitroreductase
MPIVQVSRSQDPTSDIFEAMYSLRAIRRFKPDPVPEDVLWQVLEAATQAASGGNRQPWAFIVMTDADQRRTFAEGIRERFEANGHLPGWREELAAGPEPARKRLVTSALALFEHFDQAPCVVFPALHFPSGEALEGMAAGSVIFPAVQNLLLAARALGLATTLTTVHRVWESELREMLSLPDEVTPVATIPLGYPDAWFGPLNRRSVAEVSHWGGWGMQPTS